MVHTVPHDMTVLSNYYLISPRSTSYAIVNGKESYALVNFTKEPYALVNGNLIMSTNFSKK